MPDATNADLPERVRRVLPEHAQDIYRETLNSALEEYRDPAKRRGHESLEEVANKVAWAAVEKKYAKDENGTWREK